MEELIIDNDVVLNLVVVDNDGYIVDVSKNGILVRIKVGNIVLEAKHYLSIRKYCSLFKTSMLLIEDTNGVRPALPEEESFATEGEVYSLDINIPSNYFRPGKVQIAICNIQNNNNFKDGNEKAWSKYMDTNIKYVKQ